MLQTIKMMYCRFLHFNEFDPYNERQIINSINEDINKFNNNNKPKSVLMQSKNHQNIVSSSLENRSSKKNNDNQDVVMVKSMNNSRISMPISPNRSISASKRSILGRRSFSDAFGINKDLETQRINNDGYYEPGCKRHRQRI